MKLSERLDEMFESVRGKPITVAEKAEVLTLLREAAALAKSVETATVISIESPCLGDCLADAGFTPTLRGQRVALVPLPQQIET